MGANNKSQKVLDEETRFMIGKSFAALVDHAKEKDGFGASAVYIQIYGDDENRYKENKISSMKKGDSITLYDVMKIQAWKNLSLDWLMLGKGDPPLELQEKKKEKKKHDSNENATSDTVRGFISSLMLLSLVQYVRDFEIKLSQKWDSDYWEYFINISFTLVPFNGSGYYFDYDNNRRYYNSNYHECDSASSLVYGLCALSDPNCKLLELPNNEPILLNAKIEKYKEILDFIPPFYGLNDYSTFPF